jgi:hypothetical protein
LFRGHCVTLWFTASILITVGALVRGLKGSYWVVAGRAGPLYCVVTVLLPVLGDLSFAASLYVEREMCSRVLVSVMGACAIVSVTDPRSATTL